MPKITRPFDTIDKVEQVFSALRRESETQPGVPRLTVTNFRDRVMTEIEDLTPEENAAVVRWLHSRMRG